MKTAIAIPSNTLVHGQFAISLATMLAKGAGIEDMQIAVCNVQSYSTCSNRNIAVETARREKCDYLLMIDSDLSFPPHTLEKLLKNAIDNNLDILGCNYVMRKHPHSSLVEGLGEGLVPVKGVSEVKRLPTGMLLTRLSVFDKLEKPYFMQPIQPDGTLGTEDYRFCDLARAAGFKIYMDAELSTELVHWGDVGYRWKTGNEFEALEG